MAVAVPPTVAAAIAGWGITVPSLWRDESVTGMAARMSLPELRALLADIDTVHALYYLLMRPFAALGASGPVELMLRLPSLLAFAAAAYGVAVLGRRLAGPAAGLWSGLLYAVLPIMSRYAQEARGYALVSAVAVLATWLLVAALERPSRRRFAGYGAAVALLGWLHLYALLLLAAHAVAVLAAGRAVPGTRPPRRPRSSPTSHPPRGPLRPPWPSWLLAVAGAGVALAPLVVVAAGQRDTQLFWLRSPGPPELAAFPIEVAGSAAGAAAVFGLAMWGGWSARRTPLVAAWAVLPFAISFAVSQVVPVYHPRYVLVVVPGVALAAGIGLTRLAAAAGRWRFAVAVPAVLLVAATALPAHEALRTPDSRPDDLRSLAATLDAEVRPGDRVLFVPYRYRLFVAVYGGPYERLVDLTRAPGRYGPRTAAEFTAAAAGASRIWLVSARIGKVYAADPRLVTLRSAFSAAGPARRFGSVRLTLYRPREAERRRAGVERRPAASPASPGAVTSAPAPPA
ncbi:glycosyltransferase family 39 protein [Streptosporangium pseudovulgare]|uniref:Mannosyltransferase n=1 Tax=Streptosporangium pseudovulgare TaxID=35765 RepID=A0ABQ2QGN8_9ACTN|nr:glycosyltransferase family 39 protein [Streptosporangium pseudovulgare]GGP77805.1 mannosyltransferase [Streptosporangium pseudovulgare]